MCNREFGQSTNYYRHLGLVHRITKDGQPIDDQTYAKYAQYSKRGKRIPSELKTTEQPNKPPAEPRKKGAKTTARKIPKSREFIDETSGNETDDYWITLSESELEIPDTVAAYTEPDQPNSPLTPQQGVLPKDLGKKLKRTKAALDIEAAAIIRKPTRPRNPSCRRITSTFNSATEPIRLPKLVRAPHSKRRLEIAPSVLAKKVAEGHDKSSTQLAEQLGTEYSWTSEERRQKVNVIRGMRAMERQLSTKIRRSLPLNRTTESINHFLNQPEEDCREAEEHDSDEFV